MFVDYEYSMYVAFFQVAKPVGGFIFCGTPNRPPAVTTSVLPWALAMAWCLAAKTVGGWTKDNCCIRLPIIAYVFLGYQQRLVQKRGRNASRAGKVQAQRLFPSGFPCRQRFLDASCRFAGNQDILTYDVEYSEAWHIFNSKLEPKNKPGCQGMYWLK